MKTLSINSTQNIQSAFDDFLFYKNAQGLTTSTLKTYKTHLQIIETYLGNNCAISDLRKEDINKMITDMRSKGLAQNSIASYMRTFRSFLSWANSEGLLLLKIPRYKTEETIKETYTDAELIRLIQKPNIKICSFVEYRTWVIINFLMNSGARASTIRNILIKDVDLDNGFVTYRHNKNHKIQIIPLCSQMISILSEYLIYRKGTEEDYLFCNECGLMLTDEALSSSIKRYNKKRGIQKTSIHLFRHTFAKKYLIDCGGDAFTLQRLLGHSTLDMTKHYCNIYNVDLVKNYDEFSPLQKLKTNNKRITLKHNNL